MNMEIALLTVAYLVAGILFVLSLSGLAKQETARKGNFYGMLGMVIAIVVTMSSSLISNYSMIVVALIVGALLGAIMAARVAMTAMPELVALLHSFVGLAAILVGFAAFLNPEHTGTITFIEIFIAIFIGAITFTGSILAFLKLKGSVSGSPMLLPGRHLINIGLLLGSIYLGKVFLGNGPDALQALLIMTALASVLGILLVGAIGGADMPVVVSMLNSYSGWTAAAAGFMLGNNLLIIVGALVGSSGAILSYIMCKAMNRSILSVIFGGFGAKPAKKSGDAQEPEGEILDTDVEETVNLLEQAKNVVIVPGYGMAVARAQHAVQNMTNILKDKGINVRFAIHPVAGRLPGHMNVLLAEANVPYDIVLEMDEINADFPETDIVLVIGANDIVNPGAETDECSPIYGMPVLNVWKSKRTVIMKRSRATGYAGVDNPLFYHENSRLLFGDARNTMEAIVTELRKSI